MDNPQTQFIESGLVTRVEHGIAWVNTQSKLACSSCQVESTCGNGILEKYLSGKIFISKIENRLDAKVGDKVEIAIPKSSLTQASLLVYCVPLLGLITGAFLGEGIGGTEQSAILLSAVGLFAGVAVLKWYSRKYAQTQRFTPNMVSKTSTNYSRQAFESIKVKNL